MASNVRTANVAKPGDSSIGAYRTNVQIKNNWIHDQNTSGQRNGIVLGEYSANANTNLVAEIANINISNNYIENTSSGSRGLIFSNQFRNSPGFLTYSNTVIDGNTVIVSSSQNAFFGSGPTDTLRFTAPTITNNSFSGSGVNSYNLFNANVSGNTFNGVSQLGLVDSSVANNTFNSNGSFGLGLWGSKYGANYSRNTTVSSNTFNYNRSATP